MPVIVREADLTSDDAVAVGAAVLAYLLQTELEKAERGLADPIVSQADLPERYRSEVDDPRNAYEG
jgi:hypothetical protein